MLDPPSNSTSLLQLFVTLVGKRQRHRPSFISIGTAHAVHAVRTLEHTPPRLVQVTRYLAAQARVNTLHSST